MGWELTSRSVPADKFDEDDIDNGAWELAYALQGAVLENIARAFEDSGEITNVDVDDLFSETLSELEANFFAADGEGVGFDLLRFDEWCGIEPDRRAGEESTKDSLAAGWR